jgi:hypothetical protein
MEGYELTFHILMIITGRGSASDSVQHPELTDSEHGPV